jgi:hypothetical protein
VFEDENGREGAMKVEKGWRKVEKSWRKVEEKLRKVEERLKKSWEKWSKVGEKGWEKFNPKKDLSLITKRVPYFVCHFVEYSYFLETFHSINFY